MLSSKHYTKLNTTVIVMALTTWWLVVLSLSKAYSHPPTTETNPMQFDTEFTLSLLSNTSNPTIQNPITRYPDILEKATIFFRNQYGLDISNEGSRLPNGAQLVTGSTSSLNVNNAKVRGYPIVAGSQDVGVHDDSVSIVITQPIVVAGNYGKNGLLVAGNSVLNFGFYTFYWKVNGTFVFPRTNYASMIPMKMNNNNSTTIIDYELTSNIWGKGKARGIIRTNPQTNYSKPYPTTTTTIIISSHTYPMSRTDILPKCAVIVTEQDIFDDSFIVKWNSVFLYVVRDLRIGAAIVSRHMTILHTAIDESLDSCRRMTNCSNATIVSIISHASHRVLSKLYPTQIDCLNSALKRALECKECLSMSKYELITLGKSGVLAADRILKGRENDGSSDFVDYEFSDSIASYQSHAPNYVRFPSFAQFPIVKPFAIENVSLFDQGPPPKIGSLEFEESYNEVFNYGRDDSSVRTIDQRRTALFWAGGASTPIGHWSSILQYLIRKSNIVVVDTFKISSMFKLFSSSLADATIVCWYHKYKYNFVRPITAIANRNRNTNWFPLLATPTFPEYTSGHSTVSSAAAHMLSLLLGSDDISFESTSEGLVHHVRKYQKLSDAAKEAGKSRIYGGIHYQFANQAGLNCGIEIANAVYNRLCRNGSCVL